ncbi:non-ribosomal peptide synthetase [Oxalobacteraceae bacterium A2-2]
MSALALSAFCQDQEQAYQQEQLPPRWLRQLEAWNETAADFPRQRCVHELVEDQAARVPWRTAVRCAEGSLTYAELNARANRVAHHLRSLGVRADSRVGLCAERSLAMVVGLLAILKAGGAYVPLDANYPAQRLRYMIEDGGLALLLTHHAVARQAAALAHGDPAPRLLMLDAPDTLALLDAYPDGNPARLPGQSASSLAYVIYTSGSTGQPKGVMIEHRALVNRMDGIQKMFGTGESDVFLHKTPFSFDVAVSELVWPLTIGACIAMARPDGHRDVAHLTSLIQEAGVTFVHFVPSMLTMMVREGDWAACTSVRLVTCGGEALSPEIIRQHYALHGAPLYNMYGPTETTIEATGWLCPRDPGLARVAIGKPTQNARLYILDRHGARLPQGAAGELYIGGAGVARGYLNRPDLTAERFLADPFCGEPGARMYRSGDLARFGPDGNVEFLGRADSQVKLNGLRVELGEIESRLLGHPAVAAASVLAREDIPGEQQLVAYVALTRAAASHDALPPTAALRRHLQQFLPPYMVPVLFVALKSLPLGPSGKVDTRALPVPQPTLRRLASMRRPAFDMNREQIP